MGKKRDKKKQNLSKFVFMLFGVALGLACGFLMIYYMENIASEEKQVDEAFLILGGLFLVMCLAMVVQMVIHEAGHLIFGLISGYRFSSFRIFSLMWVKEGERIRFKRMSLAGTGGQCLMTPPEPVDGRIPVILYNLGGSLLNALAGVLFLGLFFALQHFPIFSFAMLLFAVVGFGFAILNGVPLRAENVDNDGYNAIALTRDPAAMEAFRIQFLVNEQNTMGVRLKDMPKEWFFMPEDASMKNSMVAAAGVLVCNRLMDEHRFQEADAQMAHLLEIESGMVGLHRNLLICDRIYLELLGANRPEILSEMLNKDQKNFMKAMKTFLSVLRTEYAYALLGEKNSEKAEKIKAQFEKWAKRYPYQSDAQAEWELLELAERAK